MATTECSEWGPDEAQIERFPPAVSRRPPAWVSELDSQKQGLFEEVYAALHADSRRLAVMGARALLDIFLVENVGDDGTFAEKLDRLVEQGFSTRERGVLEAALDACHAAAHRGHNPTASDVNHVMDIVENLFVGKRLGFAAEWLRSTTPSRPPRR